MKQRVWTERGSGIQALKSEPQGHLFPSKATLPKLSQSVPPIRFQLGAWECGAIFHPNYHLHGMHECSCQLVCGNACVYAHAHNAFICIFNSKVKRESSVISHPFPLRKDCSPNLGFMSAAELEASKSQGSWYFCLLGVIGMHGHWAYYKGGC